ncbi:MAG: hypothetical protein J7L88_05830, partial [Thermoplasmata archaeon]|nr:hypothetical protein [Thermoplasmata archaeon]
DLKRVHLLLTNNNGFRDALDSIKVYSARGEVSPSTPAISPYNQNTSGGYILDNTTYFIFPTWLQAVSLGEDELNSLNLERGRNGIRVEGKAGEESFAASCSLSWNGYPPPKLELLQPPPHTHIPAGTPLKATFHLSGYLEGLSEMALLGFRGVGHHEVGENRTVVIDTSPLHGSVWVKYTTFRDDGTFVSRMVRYAVDAKPPHVSITATPLEVVRGEVVVVHLTLTDDVQLQRFLLKSPSGTVEMNLSGKNEEKEISLNTSSWPLGEANITVQVWDNAGLISSNYTVVSVIPPPDKTPPEVEILSPTNGTKVEAGDYVTLRGRAQDDTGLSSLILRGDLGVVDLMPYLSGGEFEVRLTTSDENVGEAVLVVAAQDLSGNSATASVRIFIYSERERETNPPVITLLSPQTIPASYPDTVSVEGEVSDDTEVEEVLVSLDMGASWEKLNLLSGRFSIVFNTTYPVEHGLLDPRSDYETLNNYPLYIRATDVWGNREKATVIINVIDNIEPELHVSASRDNGYLRVNLTFSDNLAVVSGEINFYYSDGEVWRERIPFSALEEGHYEMEIPLSPDQWGDLDVFVEDPAGGKCVKSISVERVSREVKTKGGGEGGVSLYILVALVALVASLLALLFLLWRREHHEVE